MPPTPTHTSTTPTHTTAAAPRGPLNKLYTDGVPPLNGNAPSAVTITLWLRDFARWAQLAGYGPYIEGDPPLHPDEDMNRDTLRYICFAVKSPAIRGVLADKGFDSSRRAWDWFKTKLLHGESESSVLKRQMQNAVFKEEDGFQAFLADFMLWYRHITPHLPAREAADLLHAALPQSYDPYILNAMQNPGLASKVRAEGGRNVIDEYESFNAYTESLASLVAMAGARTQARKHKHGGTSYPFDSLNTHQHTINNTTDHNLLDHTTNPSSDWDTLATQMRDNNNFSNRNTRTTPPTDLICYACGKPGHRSVDCKVEPKPQCNHGLCIHRGKRLHCPAFCPFGNPSSIRSPELRKRCIYESELWRAAQEAALKEKNHTPALHTCTDDERQEAQQHSLEDLLENAAITDFDALTTHATTDEHDETHTPNATTTGMNTYLAQTASETISPEIQEYMKSPERALMLLFHFIQCRTFLSATLAAALREALPPRCHGLLDFHLFVTGAVPPPDNGLSWKVHNSDANWELNNDQALWLLKIFVEANLPMPAYFYHLIDTALDPRWEQTLRNFYHYTTPRTAVEIEQAIAQFYKDLAAASPSAPTHLEGMLAAPASDILATIRRASFRHIWTEGGKQGFREAILERIIDTIYYSPLSETNVDRCYQTLTKYNHPYMLLIPAITKALLHNAYANDESTANIIILTCHQLHEERITQQHTPPTIHDRDYRFYKDPIALRDIHRSLGIDPHASEKICRLLTPTPTHTGNPTELELTNAAGGQSNLMPPMYSPNESALTDYSSPWSGFSVGSPASSKPSLQPWQERIEAEIRRLKLIRDSPLTDTIHTTPSLTVRSHSTSSNSSVAPSSIALRSVPHEFQWDDRGGFGSGFPPIWANQLKPGGLHPRPDRTTKFSPIPTANHQFPTSHEVSTIPGQIQAIGAADGSDPPPHQPRQPTPFSAPASAEGEVHIYNLHLGCLTHATLSSVPFCITTQAFGHKWLGGAVPRNLKSAFNTALDATPVGKESLSKLVVCTNPPQVFCVVHHSPCSNKATSPCVQVTTSKDLDIDINYQGDIEHRYVGFRNSPYSLEQMQAFQAANYEPYSPPSTPTSASTPSDTSMVGSSMFHAQLNASEGSSAFHASLGPALGTPPTLIAIPAMNTLAINSMNGTTTLIIVYINLIPHLDITPPPLLVHHHNPCALHPLHTHTYTCISHAQATTLTTTTSLKMPTTARPRKILVLRSSASARTDSLPSSPREESTSILEFKCSHHSRQEGACAMRLTLSIHLNKFCNPDSDLFKVRVKITCIEVPVSVQCQFGNKSGLDLYMTPPVLNVSSLPGTCKLSRPKPNIAYTSLIGHTGSVDHNSSSLVIFPSPPHKCSCHPGIHPPERITHTIPPMHVQQLTVSPEQKMMKPIGLIENSALRPSNPHLPSGQRCQHQQQQRQMSPYSERYWANRFNQLRSTPLRPHQCSTHRITCDLLLPGASISLYTDSPPYAIPPSFNPALTVIPAYTTHISDQHEVAEHPKAAQCTPRYGSNSSMAATMLDDPRIDPYVGERAFTAIPNNNSTLHKSTHPQSFNATVPKYLHPNHPSRCSPRGAADHSTSATGELGNTPYHSHDMPRMYHTDAAEGFNQFSIEQKHRQRAQPRLPPSRVKIAPWNTTHYERPITTLQHPPLRNEWQYKMTTQNEPTLTDRTRDKHARARLYAALRPNIITWMPIHAAGHLFRQTKSLRHPLTHQWVNINNLCNHLAQDGRYFMAIRNAFHAFDQHRIDTHLLEAIRVIRALPWNAARAITALTKEDALPPATSVRATEMLDDDGWHNKIQGEIDLLDASISTLDPSNYSGSMGHTAQHCPALATTTRDEGNITADHNGGNVPLADTPTVRTPNPSKALANVVENTLAGNVTGDTAPDKCPWCDAGEGTCGFICQCRSRLPPLYHPKSESSDTSSDNSGKDLSSPTSPYRHSWSPINHVPNNLYTSKVPADPLVRPPNSMALYEAATQAESFLLGYSTTPPQYNSDEPMVRLTAQIPWLAVIEQEVNHAKRQEGMNFRIAQDISEAFIQEVDNLNLGIPDTPVPTHHPLWHKYRATLISIRASFRKLLEAQSAHQCTQHISNQWPPDLPIGYVGEPSPTEMAEAGAHPSKAYRRAARGARHGLRALSQYAQNVNTPTLPSHVVHIVDDSKSYHLDEQDALPTHSEKDKLTPQLTLVDSGCHVDVEDERGDSGFTGPAENCHVTLVTGTNQGTRPQYRRTHIQYLIDTQDRIIEDVRPNVYSCASTQFKRCLYSPNTAAMRGITTVINPPPTPSYLLFPSGARVLLINTGKSYALPRYFSREDAERSLTLQGNDQPNGEIPALSAEISEQTNETMSAVLWHRRLGHRGVHILKQLHEHCLDAPKINTLRPITIAHLSACAICPAARLKKRAQTRNDPTMAHSNAASITSFGHSVARDHFGPLVRSFYHGYTYGQVIADIHTGGIWFYGQRDKTSEASLLAVKRFEAETSRDGPILHYHSDAAKELTGTAFTEYCLNKNPPARITYNTPGASNSNPVAEGAVFRVLSIARALLLDSGLPPEHWPAACAYACEIIQATPRVYPPLETNSGTVVSTPHYMRTGQRPSLKHFKLFGAVTHALLDPYQLKANKTVGRLESRTIIGFFAGHARQQSGGTRLWCPGSQNYIYAHTVRVDETRTFRSLQSPSKVLLCTDLPPVSNPADSQNQQGGTVRLHSLFHEQTPDTQSKNTLMAPSPAQPDSQSLPIPNTPASLTRPRQPTRLAKGTRVLVFCDNKRYYPGTIMGQRPGPDNTLEHAIIYDGYRRKYFHDFDDEDWKYEEHSHQNEAHPEYVTITRGNSTIPTVTEPRSEGADRDHRDGTEINSTQGAPADSDPNVNSEPTTNCNSSPPILHPDTTTPDQNSQGLTTTDLPSTSLAPHFSAPRPDTYGETPIANNPEKRARKSVTFFMHEDPNEKARQSQTSKQIAALTTTVTASDAPDKFSDEVVYRSWPPKHSPQTPTTNDAQRSNIVLNMFSGPYKRPDGLSAALREMGYIVEQIDSSPNGGEPGDDLLEDTVFDTLLKAAKSGRYRAIFTAPPCSTFSVTRFHDYDGPDQADRGPPIIRTRSHILGLPDIPPQHRNELRTANLLVARCAAILDSAAEVGSLWLIENPADRGCIANSATYDTRYREHGSIWQMPEVMHLANKYNAISITFPMCALNSKHQKYTTLLVHPDLAPRLEYLSSLKCTHTKGEHQRITGKDENGDWVSQSSARYTPEMCKALAESLPSPCDPKAPLSQGDQSQINDTTIAVLPTPPEPTVSPTHNTSEPYHSLATSIIGLSRSTSVPGFTLGTLTSQYREEEQSAWCPKPFPFDESEHELYHILATTLSDVKMVMDDSGTLTPRKIPRTFDEAIGGIDAPQYWGAMRKEVDAHEDIPSYELVPKPPGAKVLPSIWVYDLKLDGSLKPKKFKARLCAAGNHAREGYEFLFRHSTTTSLDAFRIFIAYAAFMGYVVHEDDYSTAYLNAEVDTEIYMQQPRGFIKYAADGSPLVCRLRRAIYGLPQSGRLWQQTHSKALTEIGFVQCVAEHALFKKEESDGTKMFLLVNVDNCYSISNDELYRCKEMDKLRAKFELNYLGPVENTLGVRVRQDPKAHTISLDQEQYIDTLTERYIQLDPERHVKKRATPYAPGLIDLQALREDHPETLKWKAPCLRLAGALNWIAAFTRPDVCFALNMCMRCVVGAHEGVYNALLHILGYLSKTASYRITYGRGVDTPLRAHVLASAPGLHSDVLQPGDPITFVDAGGGSKPTQCAFLFLFGGIVSMRVAKLACTVLSICEAEYFGATAGASRLMAIDPLLDFLHIPYQKPFLILCDNKAACQLSDNNHTTKRMRHVMTRINYLQELVAEKKIMMVHIPTDSNVSDLGTKVHCSRVLYKLTPLLFQS